MQYNKPALSIPEQVDLLLKRGLQIPDRELVETTLHKIGYYRLSAYTLPFKHTEPDPTTGKRQFLPNVSWQDVYQLYVFDSALRLLVMEAMGHIEVAVRSRWAHELANFYTDPHAYLHAEHFDCPWKHNERLAHIAKRLKENNEVFVRHYLEKYTKPFLPPVWAAVETMSLGELSRWVEATRENKIRVMVSTELGLPTIEVAQSVLHAMTYVRNIAAHHSRLWNRRFVVRLPRIKRLGKMVFEDIQTSKGEIQKQPANTIFNYLLVLAHIMQKLAPAENWPQRIADHLQTIKVEQQEKMGFQAGWDSQENWFANPPR